jgi:uncharacterized protein YggE
MDTQPVISVRGEARLEVEPEIAVVSATIEARDRDRRTVLERLATRNRQLTDLVKSHGEAIEKLESGPVTVYPELKGNKPGERIARYIGRASLTVTVRDFTVLGELTAAIADSELVTVLGPWWQLRPDSAAYREARLAAARDAILRAGEYAEAFGGRVAGLIEAADTGLLTEPGDQRAPRFHTFAAAGLAAPGPVELDFEPARQTVTAQVEARFAMEILLFIMPMWGLC